MVKTKPPFYPEGKNSKNSTEIYKVKLLNEKRYQGKKTRTKTQGP